MAKKAKKSKKLTARERTFDRIISSSGSSKRNVKQVRRTK